MTAPRPQLGTVTLCAAASVNVAATVAALQRSQARMGFARAVLFSDQRPAHLPDGIEYVEIARLRSSQAYSAFMLRDLAAHIATPHCLVVQWDGFVVDPAAWDDAFLACDYIGAPWPQFADGYDVGNGGFSLRSRRLLQACLEPAFIAAHPEDVALCRTNRLWLQAVCGMVFADHALAARFAFERSRAAGAVFGFHGAFNLIAAIGHEAFWGIYRTLDDRTTIRTDFWPIWHAVRTGPNGWRRALRMLVDRVTG